MKNETITQIIEAYDECFRLLGFPTFSTGIRQTCERLERNLKLLRRAKTQFGLRAALTREPEPDSTQLQAMIAAIRTLPYQIRKALPEAARKLPSNPGGRPPMFTPDDSKEICGLTLYLVQTGQEVNQAIENVATRKGVSARTIRRIWEKRAKPGFEFEGEAIASATPAVRGPAD